MKRRRPPGYYQLDYERRKAEYKHRALRIPVDDDAELVNVARDRDMSVNDLVLTFIAWGLEQGLTK